MKSIEIRFHAVELLQCRLRLFLAIPKLRLRRYLLQVLNLGSQSWNVKDTPEFYPGDELMIRCRV
jgi:hypothetical protein